MQESSQVMKSFCDFLAPGQRWRSAPLPGAFGHVWDFTLGNEIGPGLWEIKDAEPHNNILAHAKWWKPNEHYVMILLCSKGHES